LPLSSTPRSFFGAKRTFTRPIGESAIHSLSTFSIEPLSPFAHLGRFAGFEAKS
jgi:hypothetical protein